MDSKVSVIGLGYVGLPLALALAKHVDTLVGFDVNEERIGLLKQGVDVTAEGFEAALKDTSMVFTTSSAELKHCSIHIVTVPTPIDQDNRPDLGAILKACETIGPQLQKGAIVAFESTVYPGVTEEICGPALERSSGLKVGIDFHLGYSPERVNPGDGQNTLENVVKVVAGESESVLDRLCAVYGKVIKAGLHRAGSIRVAEAAKVIENTQRDLNIALMNELSLIFDKLGINTSEVLEAAGTKWNFLKFTPGLVGGHCIGVDPYYLTTKAEQAGYKPEVILAGRRINDNMGKFVARKLVKLLANRGVRLSSAKVAMLGLTFKENVADIRNSRVPDILAELAEYNISVDCFDPRASAREAEHEYGLKLQSNFEKQGPFDAVIVAVAHQEYVSMPVSSLVESLTDEGGIVVDVKGVFNKQQFPDHISYWSL